MPERSDVHYFGAGPAPLPSAVLERASQALLNYKAQGVGVCEISHRSADANEILADAKTALKTLLDIPDAYEVLFLQGGGSGEFSAVVYNLVGIWVEKRRVLAERDIQQSLGAKGADLERLVFERLQNEVREELKVDYLVTGSWSLKASQEAARLLGSDHVNVALDARVANNGKFGTIPSESTWNITKGNQAAFTYFCDNETVDGVEFPSFPRCLDAESSSTEGPLVVADMSSNFISRQVDVSKYGVIFGGAQKNVGNAGITIVIVKKSLLPPASSQAAPALLRRLNLPVGPVVLDWPSIAKNNSLYNTLPIFDVWIAGQVMADLVAAYGTRKISGQEEVANEKANLIYTALEKYPETYQIVPDKKVRSRMNICFRVSNGDEGREKSFIAGAQAKGLLGLKGHRSVGGIRASNYNAVSIDGAKKLVEYLEAYAATI